MNNTNRSVCLAIFIVVILPVCDFFNDPRHDLEVKKMLEQVNENMVFVKGGTFMMGDTGDGKEIEFFSNYDEVKGIKEITLDSYFINKYETTWGEYVLYLKDTGKYNFQLDPKSEIQAIHAVDKVDSPYYFKRPALAPSWAEASNYCTWLSKTTNKPYGLPTEAQWEYAARSGGKRVHFATEDGFTLDIDDYMAGEYKHRDPVTGKTVILEATDPFAKPKGNAFVYSDSYDFETLYRVVGSYAPNALGIHDMTGNAKEWTADWYDEKYYQYLPRINPTGPINPVSYIDLTAGGLTPEKTVRDWIQGSNFWALNVSLYVRGGQPVNLFDVGFRCVLNINRE